MNNRLAIIKNESGEENCDPVDDYPLHATIEFEFEEHYINDEEVSMKFPSWQSILVMPGA